MISLFFSFGTLMCCLTAATMLLFPDSVLKPYGGRIRLLSKASRAGDVGNSAA